VRHGCQPLDHKCGLQYLLGCAHAGARRTNVHTDPDTFVKEDPSRRNLQPRDICNHRSRLEQVVLLHSSFRDRLGILVRPGKCYSHHRRQLAVRLVALSQDVWHSPRQRYRE